MNEQKFQPVLAKIFQQSEQHFAQTVKIWSGIFRYNPSSLSVIFICCGFLSLGQNDHQNPLREDRKP